ncbi:carbohydrate kinase [Glutamicibacter sp.]|uniref:carbohydrate kinase family protein n=1 Tax=Glutamicibacter sp. TaxID=1931995 RepID=UPI0028BE611C|nr:carbohydrate kinase [Glutamicibacter sp.]
MSTFQVVGEALVDIVNSVAHPGGSPLNVAVGLGRLGHDVTLQTGIGDDENGRRIIEHLRDSNVHLAQRCVSDGPTGSATVNLTEYGDATYEFDLNWSLDALAPTDAQFLHTGSIAAFSKQSASKIQELFASSPAQQLRSFDPNLRPALAEKRRIVISRLEKFYALSHVVKLSHEDALWLYPGWDTARVLEHILNFGAKLAVMTFGVQGAELRTDRHEVSVPSLAVPVADTVGAGDAFTSGLLHAIAAGPLHEALLNNGAMHEADLETALQIATASAGLTVQRTGANPPRLEELNGALATHH